MNVNPAAADADWLGQLPVIGSLPPEVAAAKLREAGEDEIADALEEEAEAGPETYGKGFLGIGGDRAFQHTAHAFGYLAPAGGPQANLLEIQHAGNITPDETLKGTRIRVTLDGLRIADYPGRGTHRVLFDFAARNQTRQGAEQVHFHATYRVREGEQAAVLGRPVFVGLQVGGEGLFLQCATVNVLNEGDEALLRFLDGDVFKSGLQLLTTAQPVLAPFVALTVGLTQTVAGRNKNVPVQTVDLGLDFSDNAIRPKLAEGSYIAVQIPETARSVWSWADWRYDPVNGKLVHSQDRGMLIPYNYFVLGVSRYQGS
jgi:hypothetical protein